MVREDDSACLETQAIAAFVVGELEGDELAWAEAHAAHCSACRSVIGRAAHGASSATRGEQAGPNRTTSSELEVALPQAGDVLASKYCIEHRLGEGGMGTVFAARHQALGHRVAVRVLFHRAATRRGSFARPRCARS
jgi:putative zinc finger protein